MKLVFLDALPASSLEEGGWHGQQEIFCCQGSFTWKGNLYNQGYSAWKCLIVQSRYSAGKCNYTIKDILLWKVFYTVKDILLCCKCVLSSWYIWDFYFLLIDTVFSILKGQCHEIFDFCFHESVSPSPWVNHWGRFEFFENSRRCSQLKVHYQCRWHRWQMEKIFNHKSFNHFVWTPLGSRVNL